MAETVAVRGKPILFSSPMIKAILAGRKTQTRRVMNPQPVIDRGWYSLPRYSTGGEKGFREGAPYFGRCPYGYFGDSPQLWVRETVYIAPPRFGDPSDANAVDYEGRPRVVGYAATMNDEAVQCATAYGVKLTPSIHMPRWASRITLEITAVRVQRLQEIAEEDALAEGVDAVSVADMPRQAVWSRRQDFARLWDVINGKREGCRWADSPWVWALTFHRLEGT